MIATSLLFALVAVSSVAAECSDPTTTISAPADATGLSSCRHFPGSVKIVDNDPAADAENLKELDTLDLESIGGDLILEDSPSLVSLKGDKLKRVDGTFRMHNVTELSILRFPQLESIGSIDWFTLRSLGVFSFSETGVFIAEHGNISISNTHLRLVEHINSTSVADLVVTDNYRLVILSLGVNNVTGSIAIENNQYLSVILPNVEHTGSLSLRRIFNLAVPSLRAIAGPVLLNSNRFNALDASALTTVSGEMTYANNDERIDISFPALASIGGQLTVKNTTKLLKLPTLKSVNGDVNIEGSFTGFDLPSLDSVKGSFKISSAHDIHDTCDKLRHLAAASQCGSGQIEGNFTCMSENQINLSDNCARTDAPGNSGGRMNVGPASSQLAFLAFLIPLLL
ncbi:hypothetical protein F4811DRAFT_566839 [Daldinia bambusicola]|nr:hypothetical protein F4811DRAFT_566839 [Daldinia bambusicola]